MRTTRSVTSSTNGIRAMDFTKFFTKVVSNRRPSILREWAQQYLRTPNAIILANGLPNDQTFPFKEISVTYKDDTKYNLVGRELATALQYGSSEGFPPLVKKFREFQTRYYQPQNDHWDVIFTSGAQEGCSKIFEMIIGEGEPVMIQSPAFPGIISAIAPMVPDVIAIPQDADGIIPEEIDRVCSERLRENKPMPKLLYVNPTAANPTGTVLSEDRRQRVYQLAQKYDFLIMEDDPYYFLHFLEKPPTTFLSLDTDGRVLRLDSFSKILSSGIRLGAVTGHKILLQKIVTHIEGSVIHPSTLSQVLVYKMLESWTPERLEGHFREIQEFYRGRRDIMGKIMKKHLTGLAEWTVPKGGMFFWVSVNGLDDVYNLVREKCVEHKIFLVPGHAFNYDSTKKDSHIRLCYSFATPDEMEKALETLAKLIKEEVAKRGQTNNSH